MGKIIGLQTKKAVLVKLQLQSIYHHVSRQKEKKY